jgi:hypothetical protein
MNSAHPTRNPIQEPMKDMFPTQDRMPPHPPQEILQRPHPPGNDRRVLFRLARPLHSIVREGLFGWDRGDDEDGIERLERGSEGVEVRVSVVRLSVLSTSSLYEKHRYQSLSIFAEGHARTHPGPDHISDITRSSSIIRLDSVDDLCCAAEDTGRESIR